MQMKLCLEGEALEGVIQIPAGQSEVSLVAVKCGLMAMLGKALPTEMLEDLSSHGALASDLRVRMRTHDDDFEDVLETENCAYDVQLTPDGKLSLRIAENRMVVESRGGLPEAHGFELVAEGTVAQTWAPKLLAVSWTKVSRRSHNGAWQEVPEHNRDRNLLQL